MLSLSDPKILLSSHFSQTTRVSNNSGLLQEIEKYKTLKSQGALNSLQTDTSGSTTTALRKSRTMPTEEKIYTKQLGYPVSREKITHLTLPKKRAFTFAVRPASTSVRRSHIPQLEEAVSQSFARILSSGQFSVRGGTDLQSSKIKSPSFLSTSSTPIEGLEIEKPNLLQKSLSQQMSKLKLRNLSPKPIRKSEGRDSPSKGFSIFAEVVKQSKVERKVKASFQRSASSTRDSSPRLSRTGGDSSPKKETSNKGLEAEIETWRELGNKMIKSYKSLNEKLKTMQNGKNQTEKMVTDLKAEWKKLAIALETSQDEVAKTKETLNEAEMKKMDECELSPLVVQLQKEMNEMREENMNLRKTVEFLQDENEVLKKSVLDMNKDQYNVEYYKNLAESRLKEASTLAEQIIVLRTCLDRSHSNFLRIQKSQAPLLSTDRTTDRTTEMSSEETARSTARSNLRGEISKKVVSAKKEVKWKDELGESMTSLRIFEKTSFKSKGF